MAFSNLDNALEKGTTFTFRAWTCIADGSGDFTNHCADQENVGSSSPNQLPPPNDSATQAATAENPPEDPQEGELSI